MALLPILIISPWAPSSGSWLASVISCPPVRSCSSSLGSWTDELRDVVWLEGSEGYLSSGAGSWCDRFLSTSHSGLNSLDDLNSVERGRAFCRGVRSSAGVEEGGVWDRERAKPADGRGRRKWSGIAVGDGRGLEDGIDSGV